MTTRRHRTGLLKGALRLDAAVIALNGMTYVAAAEPLHGALGPSPGTLRATGVLLLVVAVAVGVVAAQLNPARMRAWPVLAVVAANSVWALDSVVVARLEWFRLETAGVAWALAQAAVVAGFAAIEYAGLRRTTARKETAQ